MDDTQHPLPQIDTPSLDETVVRMTLVEVLQCVHHVVASIQYRLVGTAASLIRGIALPTRDIDLLFLDRQGVALFDKALSASSTVICHQAPTWLPGSSQYFARYAIKGVEVELSTVESGMDAKHDWLECIGRGPWEHFDLIGCEAYSIPTVALELRLLTELSRRRPERYLPILRYLHTHSCSCDMDLVQRGMTAQHLPQELQHEVLASIESGSITKPS